MDHTIWRCRCKEVEAEVPTDGFRCVCYCKSCRGFAEACDASDQLDKWGGSDLIQVGADKVRIRKGVQNLAWTKMTEKGPLRWYTTCCKTPFVNTLATPALSFASVQVHNIQDQDALPPVRARVNLKGALGHVEGKRGSVWPMIAGLFWRALRARLSGRWRDNPFFDATGKPVAERQELT